MGLASTNIPGMNEGEELQSLCEALLRRACLGSSITRITLLPGGGNNRIFKVDTPLESYVAKHYFRHSQDTRNRLASEFSFLEYAAKAAPGSVPAPVAADHENGLALYEYIEGRPFENGDIDRALVSNAAAFFLALNANNNSEMALRLPNASEACFSVIDHLKLIGSRLTRLQQIEVRSPVDAEARSLATAINKTFQRISNHVISCLERSDQGAETELEPDQRCVSPSDFGFHNALRRSDESICFLDFEYAGWDDPSKMICDFFAQLALPVPSSHFEDFLNKTIEAFSKKSEIIERTLLLRPTYEIKWCCIALNVFLPEHLSRRSFANPGLDVAASKQIQIEKARRIFSDLKAG